MPKKYFRWILRVIVAAILVQTLFFKFAGADESVYIFTKLGMEQFGRNGSGVIELIAAAMVLIPRTVLTGAVLSAGVLFGDIVSHLLVLGIEVKNDGGELFILALITFICSILLIFTERHKNHRFVTF
ncbi:MAG: DoxX family protein [Flavobacterium sp. BFFFF1]|uniref:DoxX family protein n=1 Tax=unclassified Flavobacterium TaxID=196869 RepID=UPI000BD7AF73|nr:MULTISPECIES: DoxX family protein [unclassified Flavobacterium]OYU79167.1 MAG: DoxX family protein [Flavobacterium sp. BFFFF1]